MSVRCYLLGVDKRLDGLLRVILKTGDEIAVRGQLLDDGSGHVPRFQIVYLCSREIQVGIIKLAMEVYIFLRSWSSR